MRDGGGDDIAAPGILDGHRNARGDAEIAHLPRLGQAADLADLQVDHVERIFGNAFHQVADRADVLVEHEWQAGAAAHRKALLVAHAGLFDIDIEVGHGVHHARRVGHGPAGIGIGDEDVGVGEDCATGPDAPDVVIGVAPDLELEFRIALGAIAGDLFGHDSGIFLADRPVERDLFLFGAAEQLMDRQPGDLPQDVPAGDVDRRLHIGVTAQHRVHVMVERPQVRRIMPDQLGADLRDAGPDPLGIGRQVRRAERAALGITGNARVGLDRHNGRVEHFHEVAATPVVAPFAQRQIDLIDRYGGDFHVCLAAVVEKAPSPAAAQRPLPQGRGDEVARSRPCTTSPSGGEVGA